ncbi:MAG: purine-nucleoside phosphorylase [Chloroflexi bacterium]|nr:purine-nucleoside phosphorylase [Chloroflexota bacterium]
MHPNHYPILEYDPNPVAVIQPPQFGARGKVPQHCVLCFFAEVFDALAANGTLKRIGKLRSEIGDNPIYELEMDGRRLAAVHPGVGAPLAAGFLDELIGLGAQKFIACGGAGVLDREIAVGHLIVPTSAVRDEGASYHYLPPGREVSPSPDGVTAIEAALKADGIAYITGKTWTTDAIYRETPDKVKLRKSEGCIAVEMEAAAFFAVAQFRGATFAQILYGGDNLDSDKWDSRHWDRQTSVREKLFWLAAEACLRLA